MQTNPRLFALLAAGALLALALPLAHAGQGGASNAANKASAAGSTIEILPPLEGAVAVLETTIKTSPPQDLIFSVSLECALWTTVTTVGNDVSAARATVTVWVEFDGVPVPVSSGDEDGSVVFCDRLHRQTTTDFDDENATIENYLATRTSNAFNWILPDVGGGVHTVAVMADLTSTTEGAEAVAQAGVGHRTLIVEPTHMAQGATVDSGVDSGEGDLAVAAAPASSSDDAGSSLGWLGWLWSFF